MSAQRQKKKPRRKFQELRKKFYTRLNSEYRKAFSSVLSSYQRAIQLSGAIPSLNPKRGSESNRSKSSGQVKPTRSDFVADVDLCVKKVLTQRERELFLQIRQLHYLPEEKELFLMIGKLGREFERRGIYPLQQYFQSKHVVPTR